MTTVLNARKSKANLCHGNKDKDAPENEMEQSGEDTIPEQIAVPKMPMKRKRSEAKKVRALCNMHNMSHHQTWNVPKVSFFTMYVDKKTEQPGQKNQSIG